MKSSLILFAVSLLLFTIGLNGQEIISFDARFYLFAEEMWRHGFSWFPTTYGQPYPDYPVSSTALVYLSALLFGGLNKLTAVLPSAIAAALTVVVTYHIGRLHDKKLGVYAVFMLFCTLAFFKSARAMALDMYPTLFTACCFYLVYAADVKQNNRWLKWMYPLFVMSFVFRGPIGLVMPTGVVCVYYLMTRQIRRMFMTGILALLLLLLAIAGLLLLAHHVGGDTFMQDVWRMEVAGRMGHYFQPLYFYFTNSFFSYALSYPLAILAIVGAVYASRHRSQQGNDRSFLLLLMGWVLVILIGMSIPADKKVRYVLPMAPALALLAGSLWVTLLKTKFLSFLRHAVLFLFLILPGLLCMATVAAWYLAPRFLLVDTVAYLPLIVFFAVMQAGSLYGYRDDRHAARRQIDWVVFLASVCFVVTNIWVIEPIELQVDRTRDFVLSVEKQRLEKGVRLAFYHENPDELPIKYLINMGNEELPLFIADEKQLKDFRESAVILTSAKYFEALSREVRGQCHLLGEGRIGHVNVVVFEYGQ